MGAPTDEHEAGDDVTLTEVVARVRATLAAPGAGRRVEIRGAVGGVGPAITGELAADPAAALVLYVVPDDEDVSARLGDLTFFAPGSAAPGDPLEAPPVLEWPAPDTSPYAETQADRRTTMRRLALLFRLAMGYGPRVIAASAAALCRRAIPPRPFDELCTVVETGSILSRDGFLQSLQRAGYARTTTVEDPGTFAVRGAVVDFFPPVYRHPVRLELFGDRIESLRLYDGDSQRTLRTIPVAYVHPVRETLRSAGADPRARLLEAADAIAYPSSKTRHLLEHIEAGEEFFGSDGLLPLFHANLASLFAYLPKNTRIVLQDPDAVMDAAHRETVRLRESAARRHAERRLALPPEQFVLARDELDIAMGAFDRVELSALVMAGATARTDLSLSLRAEANAALRVELRAARSDAAPARAEGDDVARGLRARLAEWLGAGHTVDITASSRVHADRLAAVLRSLGFSPAAPADATAGATRLARLLAPALDGARLRLHVGPLAHGFRLPGERRVLLSEEEIFGARAHRDAQPRRAPALGDLGEVAEGDLVVHEEHGIGRYRGLRTLSLRGVPQDFLHLEYDGGALYVPVYRIGAVRRYVGGAAAAARLDRLGGNTWAERRRRVSAEVRKIAEDLLQIYAQRQALPGHAFPPPDAIFRAFEETFPFEETPDQARAIEDVLRDMQGATPMDRLVCGDVGYGKTEVALRATLLAVLGGKQVVVLAPTTVLAEQHFVTFSERFRDFPVRVASLSRFRARAEQQKVIADLAAGGVDVVIGTHRLLSGDVRFARLGLVVVDEEQRFGVSHKERLKAMRAEVDVLTLTATPIPRTLHMAMSSLREISIIATPPADRLSIRTFVSRFDDDLLRDAIDRELARGGQVFFVHNRIEDMGKWVKRVRALAPKARVAVAHGQMSEGELEKVMIDFVDGRHDVLCCTTIVESGLDIPRANTMIVNQADRLGLAQLYQLRGRIGRSRVRAFCYLVVPDGAIKGEAQQRLAVLQRFTELGAGFQIATHDLEIRGAGELLGERQHGTLAAVGFDTYTRILEDAVAELRGQPLRREHDPEINVDVPAFLPEDFIPDTGQRLDMYRRLAQADHEDEVRAVAEEMADRYGPLPPEASLLVEVMVDKTLVRALGAVAYELGPTRFVLSIGPATRLSPARVAALAQARGRRWKLPAPHRIAYTFDDRERADRLPAVRARLRELASCLEQPGAASAGAAPAAKDLRRSGLRAN